MHFFVPFVATVLVVLNVVANVRSFEAVDDVLKARTEFNAKLLKALDHQTNVIVSTYGIHSALSSVLVGAKNNTYSQLWNALGYSSTKLRHDTFLDVNKQTIYNLTMLEKSGLLFSNLFAVEQKMPIVTEFHDAMVNDFDAKVMAEDFIYHPDRATADINQWVNASTKGKIQTLFDEPLTQDTRAVIANALHFKSSWQNQFSEFLNFKAPFNLVNNKTKQVTYMTIPGYRLKNARYSRHVGFSNIQVPFDEEGRLYFGIMLPDTLPLANLDCCTSFTHTLRQAVDAPVRLTMPKFSISQTHTNIKEIFQSLGVVDLFDQVKADLSGINGQHDLFVSKIAHKATVDVNEAGVEAAAATGVVIETKSLHLDPPNTVNFIVNRPFVFTISDRQTNVDLFTGFVYDP